MEKIINDQTINQLKDFNLKLNEAVKLGNELNGILNNADEKEEEIEALRTQVVISELNMDSWRSRFKNCEERNKKLIEENNFLEKSRERWKQSCSSFASILREKDELINKWKALSEEDYQRHVDFVQKSADIEDEYRNKAYYFAITSIVLSVLLLGFVIFFFAVK